MDWTKKRKLMIRWSLLTAGLIALFWAIWYLLTGSVPEVSSVKMTPDWTITLPFAVSRWWDILLGPLFTIPIVLLITSKKIRDDRALVDGLAFELFFGLGVGLVFGLVARLDVELVTGLAFVLAFVLGVGLAFVLVFVPGVGLATGLAFMLGVGLVTGLGAGLVAGLGAGLVFGLAVGLGAVLGVGLGAGLKHVFSRKFRSTIGRWPAAK